MSAERQLRSTRATTPHIMRGEWTIHNGRFEELARERSEHWTSLYPSERLEALLGILDDWRRPNGRQLERRYRSVIVLRR